MQNILLSLVILILPFLIYETYVQIKGLKDTKNRIKELTDKIKNMSSQDIKKEAEMNDFFNDIRKLQLANVDKISNKTIREIERKNLSEDSGIRNIDRFFRLHERRNREVRLIFQGVLFTSILFLLLYIFWFQYELLVSLFKLSLNYYKEVLFFIGLSFVLAFLFLKKFRSKIVTSIKQDIGNIFYSLRFLTTNNKTKEDREREETQGLLFYTFVSLVLVLLVSGMSVILSNWFMFSCFIVGLGLFFYLINKFQR
jgi:cytochrome b subunit of formate dehydrogenase